MSQHASPVAYVTYNGTPASRFDRRYYVENHLPLVMRAWRRYGLQEASAFFPSPEHVGTLVICECRFRDEAAIHAAFEAPETSEVMQDVQNFTDIAPMRSRAAPL